MDTLIVDGYIEIAKRLKEIVSEADSRRRVHTAINYDDALKLFKKVQPETVILDINLPQNKSYELLKQIKKNNQHTIVIVLSIHIDSQTRDQCILLGADYFFDKYNDFDKIPALIKLKKAG